MRRNPVRRLAALAAVAVPVALLARAAVTNVRHAFSAPGPFTAGPVAPHGPRARPTRPPSGESVRLARGRCLAHLDRADAEARQALAASLAGLDAFFAAARRRTPRFADRVLGWEGTWRLIADRLPRGTGTGTGTYESYVRGAFRKTLFTPEQLEGQARQAVEGYLDAVREIEGVMLVRVRRDLADLATTLPPDTLDRRAIRAGFDRASAGAASRAEVGLRDDVARELVALVVAEVLARAAVRLGVSAGLLGSGAASAVATLGAGLAAGLVADQLLARACDPRGGLIRELDRGLDELRHAVVEGTANSPGLRRRLTDDDRERAARRRAAVLALSETAGGGP